MAAGSDDSDEDLMLAYGAGEAGAFDKLYARHKGGVYRYILRQCRNAGIADELFQDVWMNAIRVRASYAPTAKFTTWIYTLAHNRLVDHWRASGHMKVASIDDDENGEARDIVESIPGAANDEPETRVLSGELGAQLKDALDVAARRPAPRVPAAIRRRTVARGDRRAHGCRAWRR